MLCPLRQAAEPFWDLRSNRDDLSASLIGSGWDYMMHVKGKSCENVSEHYFTVFILSHFSCFRLLPQARFPEGKNKRQSSCLITSLFLGLNFESPGACFNVFLSGKGTGSFLLLPSTCERHLGIQKFFMHSAFFPFLTLWLPSLQHVVWRKKGLKSPLVLARIHRGIHCLFWNTVNPVGFFIRSFFFLRSGKSFQLYQSILDVQ